MDDNDRRENQIGQAYGDYQKARLLYSLGRAAMSAARGLSLVAGGSTAGAVALVVVSTIIVLIFVLGGQGHTSEIETTQVQTPSQNISEAFNVQGASENQLREIENILTVPLSFPGYKKLIADDGPIAVRLVDNLTFQGQVVDGLVNNKDEIIIRSSLPSEKLKYTIFHETGHIIALRNGRVWQSFKHSEFVFADRSCYSPLGYLKTYPFASSGGGGGAYSESFAEAIALFLMPDEKQPLSDFPRQCPATYGWAKEFIFK